MLALFDLRVFAVLFLIVALAWLAVGAPGATQQHTAAFHLPAEGTWTMGHDGGGYYPAQDCGRNHWFIFSWGDNDCVVQGKNAQPISEEAARQLEQSGESFNSVDEMLMAFEDKLAEILDSIRMSWSMH